MIPFNWYHTMTLTMNILQFSEFTCFLPKSYELQSTPQHVPPSLCLTALYILASANARFSNISLVVNFVISPYCNKTKLEIVIEIIKNNVNHTVNWQCMFARYHLISWFCNTKYVICMKQTYSLHFIYSWNHLPHDNKMLTNKRRVTVTKGTKYVLALANVSFKNISRVMNFVIFPLIVKMQNKKLSR